MKKMSQKKQTFIPTMQGGRATEEVMRTLNGIPNVQHRGADPEERTIEIEWESPTTWSQIEENLASAGYAPGEMQGDPHGQRPQPDYQSPSGG
jgi:hypothetical protein